MTLLIFTLFVFISAYAQSLAHLQGKLVLLDREVGLLLLLLLCKNSIKVEDASK